jgi:hypothetical protein
LFLLIVTEAAHLEPGYRSAVQENALVVSLQMFSLILEKCVALLREQLDRPTETQSLGPVVSEDMQALLPAVKVSSVCEIWGFHGDDYEECRLLECGTM